MSSIIPSRCVRGSRLHALTRYGRLVNRSIMRVRRPHRLSRARAVGFRKVPGVMVYHIRVPRGNRTRPRPVNGRSTRKQRKHVTHGPSLHFIAECRLMRKRAGVVLRGSYRLVKTRDYHVYEVICYSRTCEQAYRSGVAIPAKNRVFRGVTGSLSRTTRRE